MRSAPVLLATLGLALSGCLMEGQGAPDARDYQDPYADATPYPGFRDAGCGPGMSGTSGMDCGDGGIPMPENIDASPPDASLPDAAPPCDQYTFEYENDEATTVWVTGSFTGWATAPPGALVLSKEADDVWRLTTIVGEGHQSYKFVIDGDTPDEEWVTDPSNPNTEPDGYGGFNSVLELCM